MQRIENHLLVISQVKELIRSNKALQETVEEKTKEIKKLQNAIQNTVSEINKYKGEIPSGHAERFLKHLQTV